MMDRLDFNYVAAGVGIATVVVVAVLYIAPIGAAGLDCGNAVAPTEQSQATTSSQPVSDRELCEQARQSRRNLAHLLGVVGLAGSVGVFLYEGAREERERREYQRHPHGEPPHHT